MPQPRFEVPTGTINGANTLFALSMPYRPGSTAVFLNGLLLRADLDDGWSETDPDTGALTLTEPPRSSGGDPDVLQVFFIDTSPVLPETVITEIFGTIEAEGALIGSFASSVPMLGHIAANAGLAASVLSVVGMAGTVEAAASISGALVGCD